MKNELGAWARIGLFAAALVGSITLFGCGGGGGGGSTAASQATIAGTVSAPSSSSALAFNEPSGLKKFFAGLVSSAQAALGGTVGVSGVTVNLIEINSSGAQVGGVIATTTTSASGAYTLTLPQGFVADSRHVVRAVGSGSNVMDAIVTGPTVDVDPATHVTASLILGSIGANGTSLSAITPAAIEEMLATVNAHLQDVDPSTSLTTVTAMVNALKTEVNADEESANIAASIASSGVIKGKVTDISGTALPNVTVMARNFGNWVTRGKTRTDAGGNYTLRIPLGDYILGAINHTSTTAASEWWTNGGGVPNQFSAAKVTATSTASIHDFSLDPGGRITGKVTATDGVTPLPGILIQVRDFTSDQPVAMTLTGPSGSYSLNIRPGVYTLGAVNRTQQPYATALYNGPASGGSITGGGKDASQATALNITPGSIVTANLALAAGRRINGAVTESASGVGVPGIAVRFYKATGDATTGAFVTALRANLLGQYRLWLQPDVYRVDTRGQTAASVNITAGNSTQNFNAPVGKLTATIVDGMGGPVSQAKVNLFDSAGVFKGIETSDGDGTVTLYSPVTPALIQIKLDGGQMIGSNIYTSAKPTPVTTQLLLGSQVPVDTTGTTIAALGTITLPAGGVLSGRVTRAGVPVANYLVQVRSGGTTGANHFVSSRTQGDGTYSLSLPAATYTTVRACDPNNCATGNNSGSVAISAGATTNWDLIAP